MKITIEKAITFLNLDYLHSQGYRWLSVDSDSRLYAYEVEPTRSKLIGMFRSDGAPYLCLVDFPIFGTEILNWENSLRQIV